MIKKQTLLALILLLLIPAVTVGAGMLFSLINPEIAAGHPNYSRNWHLLHSLKMGVMYTSFLAILALYLFGCFLVIRSKNQSRLWLLLAPFGPLGFAVMSVLNDRAPSSTDRYSRFVRRLNVWLRIGYELFCFVAIWIVGEQIMVLKRNLMIWYQSVTTGVSTAQIIATQDASGGMWAFSEGLEVIFFVILLYLLRPILFNLAAKVISRPSSSTPQLKET